VLDYANSVRKLKLQSENIKYLKTDFLFLINANIYTNGLEGFSSLTFVEPRYVVSVVMTATGFRLFVQSSL